MRTKQRRRRKLTATLLVAAVSLLVLGLAPTLHASTTHRHRHRQLAAAAAMDAATLASATARNILVERGWRGQRQVDPVAGPVAAPTATTVPAATTTTTTTAVPVPATSVPAPPTGPGPAPAGCGGPLRITTGGTYSGCYQSTATGTAAVTVATTQPVVLDHATIRHAGRGVVNSVTGTRITLTNSKLTALAPPSRVDQRAVRLSGPALFVAEHNLLMDGMGIWLGSNSQAPLSIAPLRVRFNDTVNVARYGDPSCCVQFLQFDKVSGAADIGWNRVTNASGRSNVADNINMYESGGSGLSAIVDIHDNLIYGGYDVSGNGAGYVGGGIIAGDNGGNFTTIRNNRVVSTSNYGVAIVGGHDNHLLGNRLINDGRDDAGAPHGPSFAVGIPLWQPSVPTGPNTSATGNVVAWERPDGTRNDTWIAVAGASISGNSKLAGDVTAATEQAEMRGWAAAAGAAGLTVGPDW